MAMTTASPSMIVPSTSTPVTRAGLQHKTGDTARTQLRTLGLCCLHHARGELAGMHLGGGIGRAQPPADPNRIRQPANVATAAASGPGMCPCRRCPAVGREATIAPVAPHRVRQARMQREAAPRQRLQRRTIAPVEGQKSPRLARCRTGDAGAFDDGRVDAAATQEIGDRGTDHASATDKNAHWPAPARSHRSRVRRLDRNQKAWVGPREHRSYAATRPTGHSQALDRRYGTSEDVAKARVNRCAPIAHQSNAGWGP